MIDPAPSRPARSHAILQRTADALGVSVETFYGDLTGEIGDILELMRLWSRIGGEQGRRRVLAAARQEAERSTPSSDE